MLHRRLAIFAVCSIVAAAGCHKQAPKPPARQPAALQAAAPIPLPEPKLDREHLILAAMRALSTAALSQSDSDVQKELKGREFELRMRFGCPGATPDPTRSWTYDDRENVLRAHVSADLDGSKVPGSDLLLKDYEGVAGFIIERPMLLSTGCPAAEFAKGAPGLPTIAVAQLFTSEDSRVERPESHYDLTKAIEPSEKPAQGLDLVIAGRLTELSDGRPIHCAAAAGPPACIISAKFDRVAIEDPANGKVLGEWSHW